ncbi:MAG: hypothetical protein M1820_004550 [Bogoriella megaspora]|nr:MAG: hypothetical protein M1820_004550 [Bogoriella megaspora]
MKDGELNHSQVIFTHLIDRVPPPDESATQTLILAHRRELVEQAARHCQNAYPAKSVEIEMGNMHASGYADITIASVRSLASGDRLANYDPKRFKLVLVDEAHHIVAPQYLNILEYFRLRHPGMSQTVLLGFSATFSRLDGLSLGAVIDHIVYHKDYVDMINESWLADAIFTTVQSKADLSAVKTSKSGDFQTPSLSKAFNNPITNETTVASWKEKANERKSTLVFCVDVKHVIALTATFLQHGVEARYITGETHPRVRSATLDAFRNGKFPVLLNCGVFTEGTDIPNIDCIILARPTKSRNLLVQMIGRGTRKYAGKENCHVIDMVSSLETGIVTTPTLFGLDPSELVEKADVKEMEGIRDRKEREAELRIEALQSGSSGASPQPVKYTEYSSVTDLIEDTSQERYIREISQYAWVRVDETKYILSSRSQGFLTLDLIDGKYVVKFTQKIPGAKPGLKARPREITRSTTFEHAVHGADTFAQDTFERQYIVHFAPWRRNPASDAQLKFLNKYRQEHEQLEPNMISMGKAGDMITKIIHGARGRFQKSQQVAQRARRYDDKRDSIRQREKVKVGPLNTSAPGSESRGTPSVAATKMPQPERPVHRTIGEFYKQRRSKGAS